MEAFNIDRRDIDALARRAYAEAESIANRTGDERAACGQQQMRFQIARLRTKHIFGRSQASPPAADAGAGPRRRPSGSIGPRLLPAAELVDLVVKDDGRVVDSCETVNLAVIIRGRHAGKPGAAAHAVELERSRRTPSEHRILSAPCWNVTVQGGSSLSAWQVSANSGEAVSNNSATAGFMAILVRT